MNNLINIESREGLGLVVSSRTIAKELGKRHADVLESLDLILENGDFRSLIISSTYTVPGQTREYKEYLLTKDGFILYMFNIQGYQDFKMSYINKFNEMEEQLKNPYKLPGSYKDALLELADKVGKVEILENKIEADKPKVLFADAVSTSDTCILVGDLAKIIKQNGYEIGANRLFKELRDEGYLIKRQGSDWNMPTQKSMQLGLFEIKERAIAHSDYTEIKKTPKVTGKGQIYFINKFCGKKDLKVI